MHIKKVSIMLIYAIFFFTFSVFKRNCHYALEENIFFEVRYNVLILSKGYNEIMGLANIGVGTLDASLKR
jgi:hypothetical protein